MGPGCPLWSQNGQRCTLATICYQWPRDAGVWGTDRQRESIFHKEPLRSIQEVNYCGSTCIISRCWVVFLSEKNYRSVAAAIYNTSTNNTAGIKYSLFWITCITAMHLWKPAMNSSNTVCLGFLFFFGLIDVLFYFLVLSSFFLLSLSTSCSPVLSHAMPGRGEAWTSEPWVFCGRCWVIPMSWHWSGVRSTTEVPEQRRVFACSQPWRNNLFWMGSNREPVEVTEEGSPWFLHSLSSCPLPMVFQVVLSFLSACHLNVTGWPHVALILAWTPLAQMLNSGGWGQLIVEESPRRSGLLVSSLVLQGVLAKLWGVRRVEAVWSLWWVGGIWENKSSRNQQLPETDSVQRLSPTDTFSHRISA